MRRITLFTNYLLMSLVAFLLAGSPSSAAPLGGTISAGIGGGMGDEDVGPVVLSGKYWTRSWELGGEVFYDGDTGDAIDQFGFIWAAYRFDIHPEERNYLYMGLGPATLIDSNSFKDSFGLAGLLGWDGKNYGLEFKYGYFKPSTYSIVAYYHF